MAARRIRIVLADDHSVAREGIAALLNDEDDLQIVGEASDGDEAMRLVTEVKPDVVVIDVRMPGTGGIEATGRIVKALPDVKVLVLSMLQDARFVEEAIRSGARGYVTKSTGYKELVAAIREVAAGRVYLSASVRPSPTYANPRPPAIPADPVPSLTDREVEVLKLLATGKNVVEVGKLLGIAESTVAAHRRSIMTKMAVSSTAELVRAAIRAGIASVD